MIMHKMWNAPANLLEKVQAFEKSYFILLINYETSRAISAILKLLLILADYLINLTGRDLEEIFLFDNKAKNLFDFSHCLIKFLAS